MDWKRHVWSDKGAYYETSTNAGYVRIYEHSRNNWRIRFRNGEFMVGYFATLKEAKAAVQGFDDFITYRYVDDV